MIAFLLLIVLVIVLYYSYWKKKDQYIQEGREKVAKLIKEPDPEPDKNIAGLIYKKYKV